MASLPASGPRLKRNPCSRNDFAWTLTSSTRPLKSCGSTAGPCWTSPRTSAAVEGLHDGGIGSTVKHFPGLGGQAGDPHVALTTDPMTLRQWEDTHALALAA